LKEKYGKNNAKNRKGKEENYLRGIKRGEQ
jgi:hypothetical protein